MYKAKLYIFKTLNLKSKPQLCTLNSRHLFSRPSSQKNDVSNDEQSMGFNILS